MYNKLYSNSVIEIKGTKWQKKTDVRDRVNANIDYNILIEICTSAIFVILISSLFAILLINL